MNTTGWLKGLHVTADGTGIVSHAGVALVRALADNTGLTAGLSKALASNRLLVHDRGRVLAGLACAIADGAEVISDFRVIGDQEELFGVVASVPNGVRVPVSCAASHAGSHADERPSSCSDPRVQRTAARPRSRTDMNGSRYPHR